MPKGMIENGLDWSTSRAREKLLASLEKHKGASRPYKEIAEELGCSIYHIERGIKKLNRMDIPRPKMVRTKSCKEDAPHIDDSTPAKTLLDSLIAEAKGRRLGRDYAYASAVADMLKPYVQAIDLSPPRKIPKRADQSYDEEDVVVAISDAQIGSLIRKEEIGGLGEYNKDIFEEQLVNLENGIVRICEIEGRNRPINNLCLFYLGDMVEGHDIFKGQPYHLDMNAAESVALAVERFAKFEISLLDRVGAKRIETVEVVGNHGVPGGRKAGALPITLSWDWLFYKLKDMVTASHENINHTIAETWFQLVEVQKQVFLLLHGDDIPQYLSIPYYGIDRAAMSYMQMLEVPYHSLLLGHFHASATTPLTSGEKIVNGCWPGVSMYAAKRLRVRSFPEQWIFGVHPKRGITWRYKVALRSTKDIEKLKPTVVKMPTR